MSQASRVLLPSATVPRSAFTWSENVSSNATLKNQIPLCQHRQQPCAPLHAAPRVTSFQSETGGKTEPLKVTARAPERVRVGTVRAPRAENVPGDFFVDHTCINCDVCRWMAPEVFAKAGAKSAVHAQPTDEATRMKALQAMISCPTASIHSLDSAHLLPLAEQSFPLPVSPARLPSVFHCGFHSRKSFGAAPYLIRRPAGNVLVDSPRYSEPLARKLAALGGVRYLVLTHRDDVADHARWAARFHAERVIHALEIDEGTMRCEMVLEGTGPWSLGTDLEIVFTPGHTEGSVCLLYKEHGGVLFSGDHLAFSAAASCLSIMRRVNWFSVRAQVESARKLLPLEFQWLLPGHGRRFEFPSNDTRQAMLKELVEGEERLLLNSHSQ